MTDWSELKAPTDAVSSVNGQTGIVTLNASDVGALSTSHPASAVTSNSIEE
jgi:hypothetical protein